MLVRICTSTLLVAALALSTTSALAQDESFMVNGGGQYDTQADSGPVRVQVAGTAMSRDGKVRGEGTVQVFGTGFHGHYRYLCLELHDNIVLEVAVFTSGNAGLFALGGLGDPETGDLTGWVFAAAVQDNGKGAARIPTEWAVLGMSPRKLFLKIRATCCIFQPGILS